jgi:uncharacterized membrane protein
MYSRDYRHKAWASLTGKWGVAILASLVAALIAGAASFIPCGSLLVSGLIGVGLAGIMLDIIRGNNTDLARLFDGCQTNFVNNLITGILQSVFIFLWTLLLIVPGIIKTYAYAATFYVLKENPEMTAMDALNESQRLMYGNKMKLFCLDLSFIGWYLLSLVTFGIALIWVLPYHEAARAAFYEDIKNNE